MNNQEKIIELLKEKQLKQYELDGLVYGAVEVRVNNSKKYIYTHTKENGLQATKYIGEYSDEMYNLILNNNIKAKDLKKRIKKIDKELKELDYVDEELSKKVSINIDFARRHLADTIYKQAILEGVATTLSDTENILEGAKVSGMTPDDIMKIINLKHSWEFILNKNVILTPTNYSILCTINKLVEEGFYYNAGALRTTPVKIGGTNWTPQLPVESDIKDEIDNIISKKKSYVDIAIDLLLYVVKKQMFIDGNKRTSVIFANHFLVSKGKGLLVIPSEKAEEYKKLLIEYYETNNNLKISKFLKEKCFLEINDK